MSDAEVVDARALRITFQNGDQRSFAFEPKQVDQSTLASSFQKFFDQGYVNLEMDDRILVVPIASIQTMEIEPKPDGNLPNSVRVLHEFDH